jgi:hypothetical protein
MKLVLELQRELKTAVEGTGRDVAFAQAVRDHFRSFRAHVLAARPHLKLSNDEGDGDQKEVPSLFELFEKGDIRIEAEERETQNSAAAADSELKDETEDFWFTAPAAGAAPNPHLTFAEVKRLAKKYTANELPGHMPYRVLVDLINQHKGAWRGFAEGCVEQVAHELQQLSQKVVEELFGRFPMARQAIR